MDVANASPINLRDRWRTADGLYLREAVLERIASGRSLAGLALGEIDGRIDLRGLSTAPSEALDLQSIPVIRSISISRVDLSHCSLPGWELRGVVVEHCRFVGASLRRWGLHGVRVSDCVFADTDLRELSTGASVLGRPTEIRTSRLEGADLRKAILVDTRIVESAFIDCNLRRVGFREVDLVRTIFAGKLEEVEFGKLLVRRGERLRDFSEVDLSKATLRWPTIASVSLATSRLPESPGHVVLQRYPCVLERALRRLEAMPLTAPLRGFEDMLAAERRRRVDIGILNVDDLRTIGDSAVVDALVELLRQLEDDCRLGERGVAKVDTADTVHTREDLAPRLDGLLRELSQPVSVDQRVDGWTERDKRTMYARFRELRDRLDDPMPLGPHDIPYGWAEGLINTRRRGSLTDAIVEAETWARALVDQ